MEQRKVGLIVNPVAGLGGSVGLKGSDGIGEFVADKMEKDTYYIIGAGTTTQAVMRELELENTLIGVDLVYNFDLRL